MPSKSERNWTMFIHFAQLLNFLIPFGGLITVVILWQLKKEDSKYIDLHGKIVTNWMLSYFLYGLIGFFLVYVGIGVLVLFLLKIAILILAIFGAIKANNGDVWIYPFTIKFFK